MAFIIKCIGANSGIGMDNYIIAQFAIIIDGHIWMDNAIPADFYLLADKCIGINKCTLTYQCSFGNS